MRSSRGISAFLCSVQFGRLDYGCCFSVAAVEGPNIPPT